MNRKETTLATTSLYWCNTCSGGKDSLVISCVVRKALGTDNILHMFSDTTIEYPDTLDLPSI